MKTAPLSVSEGLALTICDCLKEWCRPEDIFATAIREHGLEAGQKVGLVLDTCRYVGALEEAVFSENELWANVHLMPQSGLGDLGTLPVAPFDWGQATTLQIYEGGVRISSPLAAGQGWIAAKVFATLPSSNWTPADPVESALAKLFAKAGFIVSADVTQPPLMLSPEAMAVHAQSRRGSARKPVGAVGPEPAPRPHITGNISLPLPDRLPDMSLVDALQARISHRPTGDVEQPLRLDDLSTLLWMTMRFRNGGTADKVAKVSRSFAGAGGWHGLDAYIALLRPPDGVPAFSRYDAVDHKLAAVTGDPEPFLTDAGDAMGTNAPAGVIILCATFASLGARYGDAAYPLILKEAGGAGQTLQLAATALGLGSCWLGGGNSRDFAQATGLNPLQFGPVAELALTGRSERTS
ncbi:MAG: SagB/ThcOx family dehydrogenase [Sulfitobacter sp.]